MFACSWESLPIYDTWNEYLYKENSANTSNKLLAAVHLTATGVANNKGFLNSTNTFLCTC